METNNNYCGNCEYLSPKEHEQTKEKEPHFCKKYNQKVLHLEHHPNIVKLDVCLEYEQLKEENEGLKARLEMEQQKRVKAGEMALAFQKENEMLNGEIGIQKDIIKFSNEVIDQLTADKAELIEMLGKVVKQIRISGKGETHRLFKSDDVTIVIEEAEESLQRMKGENEE